MASGDAPRKRARPLVLVVDDALDSRSLYAEYLAMEGFDVLEADNGVQAVATARRELPDAVVMDVGLPAIDGIEATKLLRADPTTEALPIIALSGHGEETAQRAAEAGVDRYVLKPCLPTQLLDHLRDLLGGRTKPRTR